MVRQIAEPLWPRWHHSVPQVSRPASASTSSPRTEAAWKTTGSVHRERLGGNISLFSGIAFRRLHSARNIAWPCPAGRIGRSTYRSIVDAFLYLTTRYQRCAVCCRPSKSKDDDRQEAAHCLHIMHLCHCGDGQLPSRGFQW